jgi:hypothetical protein
VEISSDPFSAPWSDFALPESSRIDCLGDPVFGTFEPNDRNVEAFFNARIKRPMSAGARNIVFASRIPPELFYGEPRRRAMRSRVDHTDLKSRSRGRGLTALIGECAEMLIGHAPPPVTYYIIEEEFRKFFGGDGIYAGLSDGQLVRASEYLSRKVLDNGGVQLRLLEVNQIVNNEWLRDDAGIISIYGRQVRLHWPLQSPDIHWRQVSLDHPLMTKSQELELKDLDEHITHDLNNSAALERLDMIESSYLH